MPVPRDKLFFIDPNRCIGCQACVQACSECDTHKGHSMIHLEYVDRQESPQTLPVVCMHCDSPTCAEVCPADAIKRTEDGVVQSARKPRCIACNNCVLACPFGVPKMNTRMELMMKCDMCYDRTSAGKRPMCATVCPSQALAYVSPETISRERRDKPTNVFYFGKQMVTTKVWMMVPPERDSISVDVVDYMWEKTS
jgi:Fe-S-cluster-containing dehydrogenase component